MSEALYQETVYFSGHVQGVGFRYATRQVAKEFEVAGYVKNLLDGRVELQAQGRTSEVKAFVEAVGQSLHGYIKKTERRATEVEERFVDFGIR